MGRFSMLDQWTVNQDGVSVLPGKLALPVLAAVWLTGGRLSDPSKRWRGCVYHVGGQSRWSIGYHATKRAAIDWCKGVLATRIIDTINAMPEDVEDDEELPS